MPDQTGSERYVEAWAKGRRAAELVVDCPNCGEDASDADYMIEAAARVLHDWDNDGNGLTWDDADTLTQDRYRVGARRVLAAEGTEGS